MNEWKYMVDDEYTFYGTYCEYYDEVAKHWKAESTRTQNELIYLNKIIPNMKDHDIKPIRSYLREDYDAVIDSIIQKGQGKDSEPYRAYADSTVKTFRRLIYYVVDVASQNGLCENVLWETRYNPKVSTDNEERIARNALLSKSLTIDQELAISKILLADPMQTGQHMGLLLMYAMGLRNAEACAVDFADIKPMQNHPECSVIWIYKTTGYDHSNRKLGGKSRNADRIIPVPDIVATLLTARRSHMEAQFGTSVDKFPIACIEDKWEERCTARQLTAAARNLFQSINMNAAQISSLDAELRDISENSLPAEERQPTAYILRRNFGMHMTILGLTESEIQYIIGHDIDADPYETRNEFIDVEKLYQISKKMAQRPLVNTIQTNTIPISTQTASVNTIDYNLAFRISADCKTIRIRLQTNEPNDVLNVKVSSYPHKQKLQSETDMFDFIESNLNRSVDVRKQYHSLYERK